MADAAAESQKYPAYRHHWSLPMILVESEAEEQALPAGYRDRPYTEEEADAATKAAAEAETHEGEPHTRRSHR